MARSMITGRETQKMQEYTQERINQAERRGVEFPTDVKEQISEYANLIGEEEKVRTLVRNLADALSKADEESVEDLLDDARMDIQDLPDPTIGKLELRDYGYTAEDMVPLRKEAALDYHRMGSKIYCLGSDGGKGEYLLRNVLEHTPSAVKHLYTVIVVFVGWGIFAMEDLGVCGAYLKACFGGAALWSGADWFRLRNYGVLFIVLILASTTLGRDGWQRLPKRAQQVLTPVLMVLSLVLSTAYLVDGSYNPFLYFRF